MPCGQSLRPKAPRGCMRNWRNAIRKVRHGFLRAIASASPARSKSWRRPAVRSPTGSATACARCLRASRSVKLFLAPDRAALYARIDARFERMLAAGALDEVRALAERSLDPLLPAMKAHGVPWLIRHLRGEISLSRSRRQGEAGHAALRQAPVHLVPPSARRLAAGRPGTGFGLAARSHWVPRTSEPPPPPFRRSPSPVSRGRMNSGPRRPLKQQLHRSLKRQA